MKSTIKKAKVALNYDSMDTSDLIIESGGTVTGLTGSSVFNKLIVPLDDITEQTTAVQTVANLISSGETTPENYRKLSEYSTTLMLSLLANGHYVEDTANMVAAGDLTKAEELILSTGYKLAKRSTHGPRSFKVVNTGTNWVHFHINKSKKGAEIHLWNYGITTKKGIIPENLIMHVTSQADIIITDVPSGSVLAMQHANNELSSKVKKYKHPTFSHTAEETYDWTDFIYVVIP